MKLNLARGKEIELYASNLELKRGKFQVQYERVFGTVSGEVQVQLDPMLSKDQQRPNGAGEPGR